MANDGIRVLHPFEIDGYIDKLECIKIEEILSPRWVVQGCRIIQLSLQAALETSQGTHEHVQHSITLHNKGLAIVWHLLAAEIWRLHLFPLLRRHETTPTSSLPFMLVLQTETSAMTLLECLAFHEDSAAALDGLSLDVIDYCVRQLTDVAAFAQTEEQLLYSPEEALHTLAGPSPQASRRGPGGHESHESHAEAEREERRVRLTLGSRAVSVLQMLSACRRRLPLCATTRLMATHDVVQLLASLLCASPWKTRHRGTPYVFQDGQWMEQELEGQAGGGGPVLTRTECQIWVTLHTLLLDPETLATYEINSRRRSALLKLRGRLDDAALAQVPALEPLAKWLASLAFVTPQAPRPPPLITSVAQLGESVAGPWRGRWPTLADLLADRFITPAPDALSALATHMASAWDLEALEALLPDTPACASCGSPAGRRCSRCRTQWYCRRECQVKHWPDHKKLCDLVMKDTDAKKNPLIKELSSDKSF
ncbi:zinc finger MYND domain-containing protein 10-like [Penaeus japonicus]|uniref:zinc finger MYND domain-containing protein 10-like n=1 Tax=Penaeus japonicus TaxID=27405 RepID=UPI001C70DE2E|nr:zinc finger MYND domain-containing protein 10-like [Penaeus japonicus]